MLLYKILSPSLWAEAQACGAVPMAGADAQDGYVHLSAAGQVAGTLARHFAALDEVVLAAFEADAFGAALRWETSRGGALFPHLYGPLSVAGAVSVRTLARDAAGVFIVPALA